MPNPVVATYAKGQWHKVLTALTKQGQLINQTPGSSVQVTYRVTGDPSPTTLEDGATFTRSHPLFGLAAEPIDIYIYPLSTDSVVEVDS